MLQSSSRSFSASSLSIASQTRSSESLNVPGSALRYFLTASSIKTTFKIELSSGRLPPERFAIPCLVMYPLSASADGPDQCQGQATGRSPPLSPAARSEARDRAELRSADGEMMATHICDWYAFDFSKACFLDCRNSYGLLDHFNCDGISSLISARLAHLA